MKKLLLFYLGIIVGGLLFLLILKDQTGFVKDYIFESESLYRKLNQNESLINLIFLVVWKRLRIFLPVACLLNTRRGDLWYGVLLFLIAITWGILGASIICEMGAIGFAVTVCMLFPQWLFYIASMYVMSRGKSTGLFQTGNQKKRIAEYALLLLIGCILEATVGNCLLCKLISYINPVE